MHRFRTAAVSAFAVLSIAGATLPAQAASSVGQAHRDKAVCARTVGLTAHCDAHVVTRDDGVTPAASATYTSGYAPADLQAANVNLRHGDPYGGSLALDQNFLWRPLASQQGHRTPVPGVWHVGASTHPGPGLGGGSGTLVAQQLLAPSLASRARRLVRR